MSTFQQMKKNSDKILNKFRENVENQNKSYNNKDERFWSVSRDKAGNGYAIIRFLPPADGDDFPYIKYFSHAFKNPKTGLWYIENSRTSLGSNEADPVSEYNSKLWNMGKKDEARAQKRKMHYVSNIYVVKDPANPENEGKVFLFKYGSKIFDRITAMTNPEFEYDKPVNVFDFWEGANFVLKMRQKDGFPNYDNSEWMATGTLENMSDADLEKVWRAQHSLKEFTSPSFFKPYEELKQRFDRVMGFAASSNNTPRTENTEVVESDISDFEDSMSGEDFLKKLEADMGSFDDTNFDFDRDEAPF